METVTRIVFVRSGLPEPMLNQPVHAADGPGRLLGFGDLVWRIEGRGEPPIKVIGEHQGEKFHTSREQREHDAARRRAFEDDGWTVQEIWRSDVTGDGPRRELVERMAWRLGPMTGAGRSLEWGGALTRLGGWWDGGATRRGCGWGLR